MLKSHKCSIPDKGVGTTGFKLSDLELTLDLQQDGKTLKSDLIFEFFLYYQLRANKSLP